MSLMDDPIDADVARHLVDSITHLDGVDSMHAGSLGEVSLLYPGARVRGLRVQGDRLEVHVVADLTGVPEGVGLVEVADRVRSTARAALAAAPEAGARIDQIDVTIADAV